MVSIGLHHQLFWLKVCDKMLFLSWCKTHYFFFFMVIKGYALIEYENFEEAQNAISSMNGAEFLTQTLTVDWAFSSGSSANGAMKRKNTRLAYALLFFFWKILRDDDLLLIERKVMEELLIWGGKSIESWNGEIYFIFGVIWRKWKDIGKSGRKCWMSSLSGIQISPILQGRKLCGLKLGILIYYLRFSFPFFPDLLTKLWGQLGT